MPSDPVQLGMRELVQAEPRQRPRPGEVEPGPGVQARGAGLLPGALGRQGVGEGDAQARESPGCQDRVVGFRILPDHPPVQSSGGHELLLLLGGSALPEGGGDLEVAAPAGDLVKQGSGRRMVGPPVMDPCQAPRRVVAEPAVAVLFREQQPIGPDRRLPLAHGFVDAADDIDGEAPPEMPGILSPELAQGLQCPGVVVPIPLDGGDPCERRAGLGAFRIVSHVPAEDLLLFVPQAHLPVHLGEPFQRQPAEVGFPQDALVQIGGGGVVPLPLKLPGFPQHGVGVTETESFRILPAKLPDSFPGAAAPGGAGAAPARLLMEGVRLAVLAYGFVGQAEIVGGSGSGLPSGRRLLQRGGAADGRLIPLLGQVELDPQEGGFQGPDALGERLLQPLEVTSRLVVLPRLRGDSAEVVEGVVAEDERGVGQRPPKERFGPGMVALGVVSEGSNEFRLGSRGGVDGSHKQPHQKDTDATSQRFHDCMETEDAMGTEDAWDCNRPWATG